MLQGIAFALSACFVWGLIFVVPEFMTGFTPIEVALGRYLVYGLISSLIFLKLFIANPQSCRYNKAIWLNILWLSLLSTIGYYTFVVLSLRYATPAICTLILGICPISIAFYGNWKEKETSFSSLIIPSIMILLGLVLINIPYFNQTNSPLNYVIGIAFSLFALVAWTLYVVQNMLFLKQNPEIKPGHLATLIGVATLFWVFLSSIVLVLFFSNQLSLDKYLVFNEELKNFLAGSFILGFVCSLIGAYLWNLSCRLLPVSLAGQLSIFETIFGVIFVYILERHIPPSIECLGIALLLSATVYGVHQFSKNSSFATH